MPSLAVFSLRYIFYRRVEVCHQFPHWGLVRCQIRSLSPRCCWALKFRGALRPFLVGLTRGPVPLIVRGQAAWMPRLLALARCPSVPRCLGVVALSPQGVVGAGHYWIETSLGLYPQLPVRP